MSIEKSEELSSQCVGCVSKVASLLCNMRVEQMRRNLAVSDQVIRLGLDTADPRSLQKAYLSVLVEQVVGLSIEQEGDWFNVVFKYIPNMTTKPGNAIHLVINSK
jgi:hypothetical protein